MNDGIAGQESTILDARSPLQQSLWPRWRVRTYHWVVGCCRWGLGIMQRRMQSFETLAWAKQRRAMGTKGIVIVHRKTDMKNFCNGKIFANAPTNGKFRGEDRTTTVARGSVPFSETFKPSFAAETACYTIAWSQYLYNNRSRMTGCAGLRIPSRSVCRTPLCLQTRRAPLFQSGSAYIP